MSFFWSLSRTRGNDGDEFPRDRTALWFGIASLAFMVGGGAATLPYILAPADPVAAAPEPPALVAPEPSPPAEPPHPAQAATEPAAPPEPKSEEAAASPTTPEVPTASLPASGGAELAGAADPAAADPGEGAVASAPEAPGSAGSDQAQAEAGSMPAESAARATVGELQPGSEAADQASAAPAEAEPPAAAEVAPAQASEGSDLPDPAAAAALEPQPVGQAKGPPFELSIPASVRARGPDSFQIGNDLYRLVSIEGLGIDTRCEREPDGRCVFHPRGALKKAILGATLTCKGVDLDASPKVIDCVKTGQQPVPEVTGNVGRAAEPGPRDASRGPVSKTSELF